MAGKNTTTSATNTGKTPTTTKIAVFTGAAKDDVLGHSVTGLTEDSSGPVHLNVLANDPGSAWLYSLAQNVVAGPDQLVVQNSVTLASGAVLAIVDGQLTMDVSSAAQHQSLAQGESATESFYYVIRMANGALSMAQASVEIKGVNDAPTLAAVNPVNILDTPEPSSGATESGMLLATDIDNGHILAFSLADMPGAVDNGDGTVSLATSYGVFTLDTQSGSYSYAANGAALDSLEAGQVHTESFSVRVTDEHGAQSETVQVAFNLVGADEQAPDPEPVNESVTFKINPSATNSGGNANSPSGFSFDAAQWAYVTSVFDANDKLDLTNVANVAVSVLDVNNDSVLDTVLAVDFTSPSSGGGNGNGNGNQGSGTNSVNIVLLGFSEFDAQVHLV